MICEESTVTKSWNGELCDIGAWWIHKHKSITKQNPISRKDTCNLQYGVTRCDAFLCTFVSSGWLWWWLTFYLLSCPSVIFILNRRDGTDFFLSRANCSIIGVTVASLSMGNVWVKIVEQLSSMALSILKTRTRIIEKKYILERKWPPSVHAGV